MTRHFPVAVVLAVALVAMPASQATTPKPAVQTPAAARPGSVALTVVTEAGAPLVGARVSIGGTVDRSGTTGADGVVTLLNVPAGTYRVRITHDSAVPLDKEITVRAGARLAAEAVLALAPPPPPPPPPPPVEPPPPPPGGPVGAPRTVSIPDLADQMLRENQPIVERDLGCSVATATRLIVARETILMHRHADADEVLYLVAGEATLTLGDRDVAIGPGWFGLAPRGTSHSLARRGRNPVVVLSVLTGQPCGG